jgi:signal transduction histidine kinase
MSPSRPNSLLLLLVVVPLALLAWLGVTLHRDSENRIREATHGIIHERLQIFQSHLLEDLSEVVGRLDGVSSESFFAAVGVSESPLTVTAVRLEGPVGTARAKAGSELAAGVLHAMFKGWPNGTSTAGSQGGQGEKIQSFLAAAEKGGWSVLRPKETRLGTRPASGLLMSSSAFNEGEVIYWRQVDEEHVLGASMPLERLLAPQRSQLTPPWLASGHGSMLVLTERNRLLHFMGNPQFDLAIDSEITLACAPPLTGLRMRYVQGPDEFPSASLFPILLGATSGSLLLPSLAWLFFRENRRELRLAQQRVSFVNQVSHELKTPLTNIRLYAEMVRARAEEADDKVAVRQLTVVESETARLSRLIQNVLNFARKQRERLSIQPRQINLSGLIENLASQWRPILTKRGIELHLDQPERVELEADPDAIEQILGNLLSNIEKYAADGCYVRLFLEDDSKHVRVSVEDKGPGIPASKKEFIFEPFERLRSDLREGVSGTGIGLTISRELARLHGGDLVVDPSYACGARFVLTLPLKPTPPPLAAP